MKLKNITKAINNQANKVILNVGFLQKDMAKIAIINEFGAHIRVTNKMRKWFAVQGIYLKKETTEIVIPPRPFMQQTVDNHNKEWTRILQTLIVKNKYDWNKTLNMLGEIVTGNIQETIEEGDFVANSPLTIKWKNGKDTPLVNTGHMRGSVAYEVL
jgi:hypothetical protein